MFKRSNKITSLLVAASVVSLVPAGVSAAEIKEIESQEGTIYTAASFKDGSYYIDGEGINGNPNSAVYYVSPDGEYKELEDIASGSTAYNFATKYTNVDDGDYAVDMTTGTVINTNIREDILDDTGIALKKQIKDDTENKYADSDKARTYSDGNIIRKTGNYFLTTYTAADGVNTPDNSGKLNVYCDVNGNYIDADYNLGKIKVNTTDAAGTVSSATIKNTEDSEHIKTGGTVSASLSNIAYINHDLDSVWRFATITVTASDEDTTITEIDGQSIADEVFEYVDGNKNEVSYKVIQKISKAAADGDIDGAKYAKKIINYHISDQYGKSLKGLDGTGDITGKNYYMLNGKFSVYSVDIDKEEVTVRNYGLKSRDGYYYLDEGNKRTDGCEVSENQYGYESGAVNTADTHLYRLYGGYLYTYNNEDDWDKLYKVDGSFNQFTIENTDNMILWNEDDSLYSVISTKPAATTIATITAGWVQAEDKTWIYKKTDGTRVTGWLLDGSTWYYLKSDGVMATGWINDNGTWYYCDTSGAMLSNTTVDGYVLNANGAWVK